VIYLGNLKCQGKFIIMKENYIFNSCLIIIRMEKVVSIPPPSKKKVWMIVSVVTVVLIVLCALSTVSRESDLEFGKVKAYGSMQTKGEFQSGKNHSEKNSFITSNGTVYHLIDNIKGLNLPNISIEPASSVIAEINSIEALAKHPSSKNVSSSNSTVPNLVTPQKNSTIVAQVQLANVTKPAVLQQKQANSTSTKAAKSK